MYNNKILYDYQYGFWKRNSTTLAMIEFSYDIYHQLDLENDVIRILIDFAKAFDTVVHDILLQRLDCCGIQEHI